MAMTASPARNPAASAAESGITPMISTRLVPGLVPELVTGVAPGLVTGVAPGLVTGVVPGLVRLSAPKVSVPMDGSLDVLAASFSAKAAVPGFSCKPKEEEAGGAASSRGLA